MFAITKEFRAGFIDAMKALCDYHLSTVRRSVDEEFRRTHTSNYTEGYLGALDFYEGLSNSMTERADKLGLTRHYTGFVPHKDFNHLDY